MKRIQCLSVFSVVIFLTGCASSGSDSDLVRRARLIANENMQLKKQFSDLNAKIDSQAKQIADLTKELDQSKQQAADLQARYYGLEKNMNAALQDCQNALAATASPETGGIPAVSCEELEKQYSETFTVLMQQLLECTQKLEKYEPQTETAPSVPTETESPAVSQ